jgi:type I restriction enzyme, S subunit
VNWLNERAVGQTMLNLNTEILGRLPGVLPETDEQTNIASMLDALEERQSIERRDLTSLGVVQRTVGAVLLTEQVRVQASNEGA